MNEADKGKVLYRGQGWDAFNSFMEALEKRGKTDTPLVVEVHRETAIVPWEPQLTQPAYPTSTVPAMISSAHPAYKPRQYGRNPQSLVDWLVVAYATPFALFDAIKDTVFRRK